MCSGRKPARKAFDTWERVTSLYAHVYCSMHWDTMLTHWAESRVDIRKHTCLLCINPFIQSSMLHADRLGGCNAKSVLKDVYTIRAHIMAANIEPTKTKPSLFRMDVQRSADNSEGDHEDPGVPRNTLHHVRLTPHLDVQVHLDMRRTKQVGRKVHIL